MPIAKIKDYLQTQGLKLPLTELQVAYAGIQAVMTHGQAEIDRTLLWCEHTEHSLSSTIPQTTENEQLIRSIFMALDSTFSRASNTVQSAVVYLMLPEKPPILLRINNQGESIEHYLSVQEETLSDHLAKRSAHTGWLNIVDNVSTWQKNGDLQGAHHQRSASQIALPVCAESGAVLGIVYLESHQPNAFANEETQTPWVALAIALIEPLQALLNNLQEEQHD